VLQFGKGGPDHPENGLIADDLLLLKSVSGEVKSIMDDGAEKRGHPIRKAENCIRCTIL